MSRRKDSADVWFHDMTLESGSGQPFDIAALREKIESCFLAVMGGRAESDGYNALVLAAGLVWRDVALIRTLSRFLRQVRVPYSQDYMWTTLRKHAAVAAQIVELFHTRFDPRADGSADERGVREASLAAAIETALQAVDSLDEDRILRRFVNAVQSAIRTNFYQHDRDGSAEAAHRGKIRKPQAGRHAVAAAALRDFRLFAPRRGRAPALRQGGARRHSLVRPAAGFPHRDPRPGQGAERQERGDRAGRRQGRFRAKAAAGRRRARGDSG